MRTVTHVIIAGRTYGHSIHPSTPGLGAQIYSRLTEFAAQRHVPNPRLVIVSSRIISQCHLAYFSPESPAAIGPRSTRSSDRRTRPSSRRPRLVRARGPG